MTDTETVYDQKLIQHTQILALFGETGYVIPAMLLCAVTDLLGLIFWRAPVRLLPAVLMLLCSGFLVNLRLPQIKRMMDWMPGPDVKNAVYEYSLSDRIINAVVRNQYNTIASKQCLLSELTGFYGTHQTGYVLCFNHQTILPIPAERFQSKEEEQQFLTTMKSMLQPAPQTRKVYQIGAILLLIASILNIAGILF